MELTNQDFSPEELQELRQEADGLEEEARQLRALIKLIEILQSGEKLGSVI